MNSILRKCGFDRDNEWMLYEESLQPFFNALQNITDENILTDLEILECQQLKQKQLYLNDDALEERLSEILEKYPGLNDFSDDIESLKTENEQLKQIKSLYEELTVEMKDTIFNINSEITNLKFSEVMLKNEGDSIYEKCIEKAEELQELQKQNKILCDELQECYTKPHTPPLFMHQIPFEPYYLKHDSFLFNLNQFIAKNFKFENEIDYQYQDQIQYLSRLDKCTISLIKFEIERMETQAKNVGIKSVCEGMDITEFSAINLEQLRRRTAELRILNSNDEVEIVMNELRGLIKQSVEQKIEMILYENTKEKFERANKRFDNLKFLSKIVSDALANAELIWIIMQLDLEKIKNRFNYTEQLQQENQKYIKRIDTVLKLQQNHSQLSIGNVCMEKISNILMKHSNVTQSSSLSSSSFTLQQFIKEYERISMSVATGFNVVAKKKQRHILNCIHELDENEKFLSTVLFNGPTCKLILEDYKFLERIYTARNEHLSIAEKIRKIRLQLQEDFEKMRNNKFWNYNQLLWIWFLTEPNKVITAIDEIRKEASKIPTVSVRRVSGIRRQ